jgi:hypothetical protein
MVYIKIVEHNEIYILYHILFLCIRFSEEIQQILIFV